VSGGSSIERDPELVAVLWRRFGEHVFFTFAGGGREHMNGDLRSTTAVAEGAGMSVLKSSFAVTHWVKAPSPGTSVLESILKITESIRNRGIVDPSTRPKQHYVGNRVAPELSEVPVVSVGRGLGQPRRRLPTRRAPAPDLHEPRLPLGLHLPFAAEEDPLKLKLDLHDLYNRGDDIDRALRGVIAGAVENKNKAPLVDIIPGKGSGLLEEARIALPRAEGDQGSLHRVE